MAQGFVVTLAGRLSERVELVGPAGSLALFAEVRPLALTLPQVEGEALSDRPRWRVTVRRVEGVTLAHRLTWRGRPLRLLRVGEDPAVPEVLTLVAEEEP